MWCAGTEAAHRVWHGQCVHHAVLALAHGVQRDALGLADHALLYGRPTPRRRAHPAAARAVRAAARALPGCPGGRRRSL